MLHWSPTKLEQFQKLIFSKICGFLEESYCFSTELVQQSKLHSALTFVFPAIFPNRLK